MKHRRVFIDTLPQVYEVIKEMNPDQNDADYRSAGRQSLEVILERRMQERISLYLGQIARLGLGELSHRSLPEGFDRGGP